MKLLREVVLYIKEKTYHDIFVMKCLFKITANKRRKLMIRYLPRYSYFNTHFVIYIDEWKMFALGNISISLNFTESNRSCNCLL